MLATTTVAALLAASLLAASAPASAAEPIDGAHTSNDPMFPNVGNGGYDALDYEVTIAWSPTGFANGVATGVFDEASTLMTARAIEPLKSFSMDFEGLTVDSVEVNGQPATWTRDIDADAIKYKLIVTPATPVEGEFSVMVKYHGVPQYHTDADGSQEGWSGTNDGAMLLGQPIGMMTAFPHNNTPGDKATYRIEVDAPSISTDINGVSAPTEVASNGELVAKIPRPDGSRTTWVWYQQEQMASELVVIGIGRYELVEGSVTLSDGRVIPSLSYIDFGYTDAQKTTVRNRIAQLQPITQNLEKLFGPYPGNSTGVIVKSVPGAINYALETQDRSFFPSVNSVNGNTLIHELVHQWYGNNVAPRTWTDIWMGEGMATWAPTYYNTTEGFGANAARSEQTYFTSWNNKAASSADWSIAPGGQTDSAELYSYQTYTRGAQFWAALRVAIGDEPFFALIRQWQTDNGGTSRTGAELMALAEKLSGRDLDAFWSDWILEPGKPAWPDKSTITLKTDAVAPLEPGDKTLLTVTAANTGYVPLAATSVSVDLSGVLANATLGALPAEASVSGTTLTWTVPAIPPGNISELSFTATIDDDAPGGNVVVAASSASLGTTCATCTAEFAVEEVLAPTQAPTIAGKAVVGETLTASSAGWPEGTVLSYQWNIDGKPYTPAPADQVDADADAEPVLLLAAADVAANQFVIPAEALGTRITVTVTGTLAGFRDGSATSDPTAVVVAAAAPGGGGGVGGGAGTPGAGAADPDDQLSATGGELPIAAGLLALVMLVGGGIVAVARRRSRLEV